ncbi:transient receptor potential channel pyrexia-like [Macrobrachium nipponense]|uniref:transient receptor potential channel pyrexia-like n=1 Tax=Macrobrachium nipponense TaxID=159736 RepID=UPI0030C806A7
MIHRKIIFTRSDSLENAPQETPVLRGPQPDSRFSLLLEALKIQNLIGVRTQLARGLPVNHREAAKGNRTPLIYAVKHDFLEAVVELLGRGANVAIADGNGVTPLHMAAAGGQISLVKLLLSHGASPDPMDDHSRTPLHYAARAATQDPSDRGIVSVVETLLRAGALRGRRDREGRIPLHNAATAGSPNLIKALVGPKNTPTLNMKENEGRTPLHCAVVGGRSLEAVKVLIQLGCTVDARDAQGHTPMHLVAARQVNYVNDEFDGACLELLLSQGASVSAKNDDGYNALSLALLRTMWWGRPNARDYVQHAVELLVAKGSCIQDGFAMWRMVESFPSLVPVALNRSVYSNTSVRDSPHLRIDFDFGPLTVDAKQLREIHRQSPLNPQSELPSPLLKDREVAMLHYILWAGRKNLLRHPLCNTFLHLKWCKVRKYFLANVIYYLLFVMSLTGFLLSSKNCPTSTYSAEIHGNHSSAGNVTQECWWAGKESGLVGFTWWCLVIFYGILTLREIVQVLQNPMLYIKNVGNLFDASLVVCVPQLLVNIFPEEQDAIPTCCLAMWQQKVGAIAIILAWVRLMLFTGQFPSCGVYIVMFSTVAKNVLKFLAMYACVLVAFAFGFYVLLRPTKRTFSSPGISLVTSLVMMTGELDYESIFLENENSPALLSIIILVVFIILVFIILSNLLVGLAVSDMYSIRQRSEVLRLTRHVELMTQVEALFRSRFMPKKLTAFFLKNISITDGLQKPSVSIFPNRTNGFIDCLFILLSRWLPSRRFLIKVFEIFVSGFIAPEHEPSLPKELLVDTVNIALREHELDKRDRILHLRAHQSGVAGQHKYLPFHQQPVTNQTTLMNKSTIMRTTSVGQRNSWRWTFTSDTDVEDDAENALQVLQTQPSVRASWLGVAPVRSVAPDPNAKLDELRVMVLGLQSTVENLMTIIHQQQRPEASPLTQRNIQVTLTENTSSEVSV